MVAFLFTVAIVVSVSVVFGKRWAKRRAENAWKSQPGLSPENPIEVSRYDQIEESLYRIRCLCGGRLDRLAESSRPPLRCIKAECSVCEHEAYLFFDTRKVLN